ncbi:alpha/beta hydrolase family protein [Kosakonia oryziphila]|uniref:Alpha/beta hydrolase family protein n=1 Tax=Kosakonia oryziphila TaxID=1005667 RepID=A0A1C4D218_9ENTR|nr:alpha/beta hydrolase [Kosakonia oryziphila]SCC25369.1 Alpha/beta hydrolase family protein [Kosakonia oryziphila]
MLRAFNYFFYMLLALCAVSAFAQETTQQPIKVSDGITYELIGRWDVDRLNKILTVDTPAFSGVNVKYTPAKNAVKLYRVIYPSSIPEHGNKPTMTSGLLAIPDTAGKSFPMVSYQHGTVYGKHQVPSFPDESPETQLMIAQFASQGYIVIGADYFGLGVSTEPEGYMVKASHQQATYDMINSSRQVLAQMGLENPHLFLAGWSQGGFVTMALLEKLEAIGMKVQATATASAPLDVFALMNGFLSFPRKFDADWLNSIVILSAFAYENYYGIPGLARSVITDEYYDVAKKAYDRQPFNPADITSDLHKLIRPEYFDPQYFANSAYGRLMSDAQAYRWVIASPVHNYYGEADEAITVGVGKMAMTYAQSMGAGNTLVEAISTGKTTHRGTFATAVPLWKIWFDSKQ